MGDFNTVLGAHESLGLHSPARSSCEDFRSVIEDCDLIGVRSQCALFNWARGCYPHTRVERRLDRALVSEGCISCWRDISCVALPLRFLDHCLLVIRLSDIENVSPRPFRLKSMWLDHPDFMALVRRIWSSSLVGKPSQMVINKLKRLKNALTTWNCEVFGDLNSKITGKSEELQSIQLQMSNLGFSEKLFLAESRVHHKLDVLFRRYDCFYRDWSRVKWLQDGDRNSSFFHASVRRRQYMNVLSSLSINGVLTDDRLIIRDHIIKFYSNLFSLDPSRVETEFPVVEDVIPSLVTDVENTFLISIPSTDNIHDAVFATLRTISL
ncbi:hypothetical protein Dsin_016939 [Dipteronia sinensis]|uniref:Endonuclease/exonuclease/phosphatase domain-containing protein n=1 Tax=Dipteronia sinensis TaxID=43782 RepID=A0AAE0AF00_9ROSI|nr:hypothetical protein Dsin_016939 [Dipteronia sinensis]